MHIKTYQAENMQKALKLVRRDLGSEAIIVTTKSFGKKKRAGDAGGQGGVEVVAAIDYDLDSAAHEGKDFSRLITTRSGKKSGVQYSDRKGSRPEKGTRGIPTLSQSPEADAISEELRELKWMTQFLLRKTGEMKHQRLPEKLFKLSCQMLKQEVCEELVVKLMGALQQELSPEALRDEDQVKKGLISNMERELPLSGPLSVTAGRAKIAAFVGPTGVGKTTTVAKLAALESLTNKKKVALVSIDNYRIAAQEQLRIYATIMGLPFKAVSSPEELERTVTHFADKDLILIDTAGRSQRDQGHLAEIKQYLKQSFPVEIYLVMSVTHTENNLSAISRQYGLLSVDRLIFSKLDESCTYGTMLNQLVRINKPLSYLTTGQKVPEDIEIATQERIASLLLGEAEIHYC